MNDPSDTYEDIINLPHHVSRIHPHMTLEERAAQFSPFAALTGYEAAIDKTRRRAQQELEEDKVPYALGIRNIVDKAEMKAKLEEFLATKQ